MIIFAVKTQYVCIDYMINNNIQHSCGAFHMQHALVYLITDQEVLRVKF